MNILVYSFMGVTEVVRLIYTFLAQLCMSVGKSGHEGVKGMANGGRLRDYLGFGKYIYIWFASTLLYCWLIQLNFLTHAML